MEKQYHISFWLDQRHKKTNGKFPVKLRVFTPTPRKQILYKTKFDLTVKEFDLIWNPPADKVRNADHKVIRAAMDGHYKYAEELAAKLKPFNFEGFGKLWGTSKGEIVNIVYHYNVTIAKLNKDGKFGNESCYDLALKSFIRYVKYRGNLQSDAVITTILFTEITKDWLSGYQNYMLKSELSRTTVSMYLRTLRAVFNAGIKEGIIEKDIYPFGKGQYVLPKVKRVKKAFDMQTLAKLYKAIPDTNEQQKAKDFWFFIYFCSGINVKDIALAKWKDIDGRLFTYFRAKTIDTSNEVTEIVVHLGDFAMKVIENEKYSNKDRSPKNYVFDILNVNMSEREKHDKIKNFTRFINQNLRKMVIKQGIAKEISTYWARHSFSTQAVKNGASLEQIMQAFGHNNIKTTQNYFGGFGSETMKQISEQLESQLN
jgi:integrase/recombinase XerD